MSPQEGNILTRRTFVEHDGNTDKRMPVVDFDVFLNVEEDLSKIDTQTLADRLRQGFVPYTDEGDETHPRIILVDFELERDGDDDIAIVSPFIFEPEVMSVKKLLTDGVYDDELFSRFADSFRALSDKLLQTTFRQANSSESLLWYEATPSQFLFIPPGSNAIIGEKAEEGGAMGTFVLVDLDPRFVKVSHSGPAFNEFSEKLDIQFVLLTGESACLAGFTPKAPNSADDFESGTLQHPDFVRNFPLSHSILDAMLVEIAA